MELQCGICDHEMVMIFVNRLESLSVHVDLLMTCQLSTVNCQLSTHDMTHLKNLSHSNAIDRAPLVRKRKATWRDHKGWYAQITIMCISLSRSAIFFEHPPINVRDRTIVFYLTLHPMWEVRDMTIQLKGTNEEGLRIE